MNNQLHHRISDYSFQVDFKLGLSDWLVSFDMLSHVIHVTLNWLGA